MQHQNFSGPRHIGHAILLCEPTCLGQRQDAHRLWAYEASLPARRCRHSYDNCCHSSVTCGVPHFPAFVEIHNKPEGRLSGTYLGMYLIIILDH